MLVSIKNKILCINNGQKSVNFSPLVWDNETCIVNFRKKKLCTAANN
jgi:hypothetical protein